MNNIPTTEQVPIKTQYSATKRLAKGCKKVKKIIGDEIPFATSAVGSTMPMSKTAKKRAKSKKPMKIKKGGKKKC